LIIGCAMKVHRYFGPGFPEIIYKRAPLIELEKNHLAYRPEMEREIFYEDRLIAKRRLDLLVQDNILVELKPVTEVTNGYYAQVINYLRVFGIEIGLLLNFGSASLQFKRFINTRQSVKSF
ncbi:MAG TPA: GxxExxY protein, partial [Acidobacteriota bacterium]